MLGTTEIVIIVGVVVILFGASAISKFSRAIGKAKGEFEKGAKEAKLEDGAEKPKDETDAG